MLCWSFVVHVICAPSAKRFCLYLNAPDSFFYNSIWADTLLICVNEVTSKTYLILYCTQRYSYSWFWGRQWGVLTPTNLPPHSVRDWPYGSETPNRHRERSLQQKIWNVSVVSHVPLKHATVLRKVEMQRTASIRATVDELCAGQEEELERVCMRQSDTVLFRVKCHESILSLARQKSRSYRESGQCTALERVKGVNGRLWFERQWLSLTHWWVLPRRVVQTAHRRDGWRDYVRYTEQTKRVTSTHTSSGCCFPRPVTSGDAQRRFLHNVRFKHSTQN